MWRLIKEIPGGIKMGVGIASGVITGIAAAFGIMMSPIQNNAAAIELWGVQVEEVRDIAETNADNNRLMNAKLDRMLCNQDPEMSWDRCERMYGSNGSH